MPNLSREQEGKRAQRGESTNGDQEPESSKTQHKVKFSLGGDDDDIVQIHAPRKPLPLLRIQNGQSASTLRTLDLIGSQSTDVTDSPLQSVDDGPFSNPADISLKSAHQKAKKLADKLGASSGSLSRRSSGDDTASSSSFTESHGLLTRRDDVPLTVLRRQAGGRPFSPVESSINEDEGTASRAGKKEEDTNSHHSDQNRSKEEDEAHRLVRAMTNRIHSAGSRSASHSQDEHIPEQRFSADHHDPEANKKKETVFKPSILSMLLKVYQQHGPLTALTTGARTEHPEHPPQQHQPRRPPETERYEDGSPASSGTNSPSDHGASIPRKQWYDKSSRSASETSLVGLLQHAVRPGSSASLNAGSNARPKLNGSQSMPVAIMSSIAQKLIPREPDPAQVITVHIADVLARQNYLLTMARALMVYGAPTHRLEELIAKAAEFLQIDGQFLYLPGCMICSFDDKDLHTTEVKLVTAKEGVDLGKFDNVNLIYKEVNHDIITLDEAMKRLEEVNESPGKHRLRTRILMFGLASASVGPFAFGARPIDLGPSFILGCFLGILQLWLSPKSKEYSTVFEITATIFTSFASRGLGSIRYRDGSSVFCFSALAQSSIALILPGYIILCASMELQSKNLIAGSVRMVYAIIFALMLGFGITIGSIFYALMDKHATSEISCTPQPGMAWWNNHPHAQRFFFVPIFTLCLTMINQAKWTQTPVMLVLAFAGYQVNYWSAAKFINNVQVANTLGALTIGVFGSFYARASHGLSSAYMIPAIFVQVPSGIAASGSLVSGLTSADQITGNATGISVISNGTQGFKDAQNATGLETSRVYSGTVFNVGYGMIQVAIGISVGLFLSSLIVYPFGKRRSGMNAF